MHPIPQAHLIFDFSSLFLISVLLDFNFILKFFVVDFNSAFFSYLFMCGVFCKCMSQIFFFHQRHLFSSMNCRTILLSCMKTTLQKRSCSPSPYSKRRLVSKRINVAPCEITVSFLHSSSLLLEGSKGQYDIVKIKNEI